MPAKPRDFRAFRSRSLLELEQKFTTFRILSKRRCVPDSPVFDFFCCSLQPGQPKERFPFVTSCSLVSEVVIFTEKRVLSDNVLAILLFIVALQRTTSTPMSWKRTTHVTCNTTFQLPRAVRRRSMNTKWKKMISYWPIRYATAQITHAHSSRVHRTCIAVDCSSGVVVRGAISRGYIDLVRHAYYAGMPEWSKGPDSSANMLHRKNWWDFW